MKKKHEPDETDLINVDIEYLIRLVCRDLKNNYKDNDNFSLEKNIKYNCIRKRVLDKLARLAFKTKNYGDCND